MHAVGPRQPRDVDPVIHDQPRARGVRARHDIAGALKALCRGRCFVAELQEAGAASQEGLEDRERLEPPLAAQINVEYGIETGQHSH